MNLIHIVGRQNLGKTTLIVELVNEYVRLGSAVGTIKHSSHVHGLDTPGKDSYRHRQAGATPAAVIASGMIGVGLPRVAPADPYPIIAPMFSDCRLVLSRRGQPGPRQRHADARQGRQAGTDPGAAPGRQLQIHAFPARQCAVADPYTGFTERWERRQYVDCGAHLRTVCAVPPAGRCRWDALSNQPLTLENVSCLWVSRHKGEFDCHVEHHSQPFPSAPCSGKPLVRAQTLLAWAEGWVRDG
jgi:hypothetical protein